MFYDRYLAICEAHGVAPTTVLTQLKISKGTISNWKAGSEPLNKTKKQIADYFGMSVAELMGEVTPDKPSEPQQSTQFTLSLSEEELEIIKKYRAIDARGKGTVISILDREYLIVKQSAEEADKQIKGTA